MRAKVILARRMPFSVPFLDYSVPEKLKNLVKVGNLVKVPLRTKFEYGIILSLSHIDDAKNLKAIENIEGVNPALSDEQLSFLVDVSRLYHTSLGFLLKTNLLPLQKRKLAKLVFTANEFMNKPEKPSQIASYYSNNSEKINYILSIININNGGQKLILVPELSYINQISGRLNVNNTEIITGELSNKELFDRWANIQSGKKRVIIGTRRSLFLPWSNLRDIIVDDEANSNYKSWDMAPRYHTMDAVWLLAQKFGSTIYCTGHTPSLKIYNDFLPKINKLINAAIEIVDLRDERKSGNYGLMSDAFAKAILNTEDGDIFVYLNKRGSSSYVGCRDCGFIYKCPDCKLSLTYHQNSGALKCHFCDYQTKMTQFCPKCHGITLNMFGAGTQLAETAIKKLVAGKRFVVRLDSDNDNYSSGLADEKKIIVGTQQAWRRIDWSRIKLMVFADADASLFIPEFNISEVLWYLLRDAQYRMPIGSKIMVQTGNPNHILFTSIHNPEKFYNSELDDRKALAYPPYSFIIRLFCGYASDALAFRESEKLFALLDSLTKQNHDIIISSPIPMTPVIYQRLYWRVIIVKIVKNEKTINSWQEVADMVPDCWKIDPNPSSLLNFS